MNYLDYENKVRQDSDENQKMKQKMYIKYFKDCKNVADLACGKGAFLELLRESGINALGVDSDEAVCDYVKKKGLRVIKEDLFNFLSKNKEKFDGIMASHIIEHFDVQTAKKLIELCCNNLSENGLLIIITPNNESIPANLYFYKDPTHVRFYPLDLINFMAESSGFSVSVSGVNTLTKASYPGIGGDLGNLNDDFNKLFLNKEIEAFNKLNERLKAVENYLLMPMDAFTVLKKVINK